MKKLGIIGFPLAHSFSKRYFEEKFRNENIEGYTHDAYPMATFEKFSEWIRANPGIIGLNVTIHHKINIIPYLDELDTEASAVGAVNTIKITNTNGKPFLKGYNTDVFGFTESLKKHLLPHHQSALILGTGGASRAVAYSLDKLGIPFQKVSRHKAEGFLTYEELDEEIMKANPIIINTTPLGMAPDTEGNPDIPYHAISAKHLVFDLIYNPSETLFMKKAAAKGATVLNGLEMFHLQAEKSWVIWAGSY